jgi:15-cis-phytoene synthase
MSAATGSQDAVAFCAELVRSHDFPRYAATLFVSPLQRRGLLALYAFNVEIARVRDSVSQPLPGEIRLQWWSDMLAGRAYGGVEGNPVAAELLAAIQHWELPVEPLARLVDEHQFDLYNDPMPTMAALEGYANDTSSMLLALAAQMLGPPSEAIDHVARHAGLALAFAQVITSLPRDAARRQLFVPLQLLASHGSTIEEVFAGRPTPAIRAALLELIDEAKRHLKTALRLLPEVPPQVRPAFLPLALVRRDLTRMSRTDANPFQPHVTSRLVMLWTLWRASRLKTFKNG